MQRLVNTGLLIERQLRIHLSRHLARHNLQNLTAELHKQVVKCGIDLLINVLAVLLSILAGVVDQLRILRLLRGREDERRVGRGILRLVLVDRCEVARVADNDLLFTNQ
jgi:hypothetical protein